MKKLCINFLIFSSYLSSFGMFRARDIFEAIEQHDEKAVAYYIAGGQVNYTKKFGLSFEYHKETLTPLVKAICIGDENIIRLLIEGGANIHEYSVVSEREHKKERSPLDWVLLKLWPKDKRVARNVIALLLKNPGWDAVNKDRALRHGCTLGRTSPVSFLLECGADPLDWGYVPEALIKEEDGRELEGFNSFSIDTTSEVRDILFAHVISQMKKEKPDMAVELEKFYRAEED